MVFQANPAYHHGSPKIARIIWHFIPDENAIITGLRAHNIDLVDKLGVAPYAQLGSVPGLIPSIGSSLGGSISSSIRRRVPYTTLAFGAHCARART